MPVYEYYCARCNCEFELRLLLSEFNRPQLCPKCHSSARRLISSFSTKNAGNIEIAEKPFRKKAAKGPEPPPIKKKLRSPPAKKS